MKSLPISIWVRKTMLPFIVKDRITGNPYYIDDCFDCTALPIQYNHILFMKENSVPKGRNHINDIERFWSFTKTLNLPVSS